MDAQTLFKQGIAAIRERQDIVRGQQYLIQSLRLDPRNEMAWLWLSHTYSDPKKQIACLDRVLRLNPQNERALARKRTLLACPPDDPIQIPVLETSPAPAQPPRNAPFSTAPQAELSPIEARSAPFEAGSLLYSPQTQADPASFFTPTDHDPFGLTTSHQSNVAAPKLEISPEDRRDFKRLFLSKGSKAAITVEEILHRRGHDWNTAHALTQKLTLEATHEAELKNGLFNLFMGSMLILVSLGLWLGSVKIFQALGGSGYVFGIGIFMSGCGQAGYGIKLLIRSRSD